MFNGIWMPKHFERMCLAIDQLPSKFFSCSVACGNKSFPRASGSHLSQRDDDTASLSKEGDGQSSIADHRIYSRHVIRTSGGKEAEEGDGLYEIAPVQRTVYRSPKYETNRH